MPLKKDEPVADLALDATLRARAARGRIEGSGPGFIREDLRRKERKRTQGRLVVFLVDASESMGTEQRMAAAKGAVLSLLSNAYLQRDRVSVVVFFGEKAQVLLPPTNSVTLARERLARLPTGGATPFARGLLEALDVIKIQRIKDPQLQPMLVIISDGEANVSLTRGSRAAADLEKAALRVAGEKVTSLVIDTGAVVKRTGCMPDLAEWLNAKYYHIDGLRLSDLVQAVQKNSES